MITFFVSGIPKTAGSKRGFYAPKLKRVIITDDAGQAGKDWRHDVKCAALDVYQGAPMAGPVRLIVTFYFPRPKSHYRTGNNAHLLRTEAPHRHIVKPDATKCLRALEDALTGIVWKDDAQIVDQTVVKRYCDEEHPTPGAWVSVRELLP